MPARGVRMVRTTLESKPLLVSAARRIPIRSLSYIMANDTHGHLFGFIVADPIRDVSRLRLRYRLCVPSRPCRDRVARPFGFPSQIRAGGFPAPGSSESNPRHIRACANVRVMRGVGRRKRAVRVSNSGQPMRRFFGCAVSDDAASFEALRGRSR